ncbi:diacylglycerol lipase-beta-like [Uloborus diversus]|uniref:diacylglycerol lipase-beta-like n=1 Tax=Uloborus diversus TaxID=327109 RepID=UPI002409C1EA|nr:diacylglycerol lipase-beta-like [Uloborus diversus]XP_054706287.1 diacylglycerol lipase-beta-like [Uloborus diversus]
MPGMRIFGRRCSIATDDFFFIGIVDSVIYLPWLAWIPVVYASYVKQRFFCNDETSQPLIDVSLPSLCILFFFNWLLGCLFVLFSVRGTISQPEPRRHVVTLVYAKLFVSILDMGCAILGTVILVQNSFCGIIGVDIVIKVATIFQWLATLFRIGMIIVFYDWNSSKKTKVRIQKEYFTAPVRTGTFKRWNIRFQTLFLWCTTPSEARKEAIKAASELMALLSCDLDLVASDVIAGLLLYRKKCLKNWKTEKLAIAASPPIVLLDGKAVDRFPPSDMPSWMNLKLARRYFNLGLGVFGWPWVIYRNISCGCCLLFKRLLCCFRCRKRSGIVLGDNCCGCNLSGLRVTTQLPYEDLVHVSFVDRVFQVPFYVTYDHETQAVLVTARGTFSVDDVLTDISAGFSPMDDRGSPEGSLCHHGMLTAAREIKAKLEEGEILQEAFKEKPDYQLVVTGHSLGASVASILTMLLKVEYPNVRCFSFAPAPTMNKAALATTYDNVFTIVYGNDSVPYLNYENVKYMVIEMVKCLKECKLPKYKVFMSCKDRHDDSDCDEKCDNYEVDFKSNGKCKKNGLDDPFKVGETDLEKSGSPVAPCTEHLYVAGRILHIKRTSDGYRLKMVTENEYTPLVFRPNMVLEHFPQYVQACLEQIGHSTVIEAKDLAYPTEKESCKR